MKNFIFTLITKNYNTLINMFKKNLFKMLNKCVKIFSKTTSFINDDVDVKPIRNARWKTWFPFSFFYGNGLFQPLYYLSWLFCHIAALFLCLKAYGIWLRIKAGTFTPEDISAADIAAMLGFVGTIITLYNINRNAKGKKEEKKKELITKEPKGN